MHYHVVYGPRDEREIQAQLQKLDEHLFLDKDIDPMYGIYYSVKFWNGERAPNPVTVVVDWRDARGVPLPLHDGIVSEVQRQQARGPVLEAVMRANEQYKDELDRKSQNDYAEIVHEVVPLMDEKRSGLLQRGQHLRRSRDRERAKGKKV